MTEAHLRISDYLLLPDMDRLETPGYNATVKPVRFSRHAREQMTLRGATEDEVVAAIRGAEWSAAPFGRFECRKEYA